MIMMTSATLQRLRTCVCDCSTGEQRDGHLPVWAQGANAARKKLRNCCLVWPGCLALPFFLAFNYERFLESARVRVVLVSSWSIFWLTKENWPGRLSPQNSPAHTLTYMCSSISCRPLKATLWKQQKRRRFARYFKLHAQTEAFNYVTSFSF